MFDASTSATARVRELSRGGRRKNDVIDAAAAASVAALQGDASLVVPEDTTVVFALLEERRANVAAQRVRSVNQLHALLRDLIPGGAPTALKANTAATLLRKVRPKKPPEATREDPRVGPGTRDPKHRHPPGGDHRADDRSPPRLRQQTAQR